MRTFSRRRIVSAGVSFAFAEAVFACMSAAGEPSLERLQIVTATGVHELSVEVARTSKERAKGLMFRRSLPKDRGMLFDFQAEQMMCMWMKNTYSPLDMICVSRTGRVVSVAERAEPMSERTISSGAPAYAVIEANAGTAKRFAVSAGDVVRHPIFGPSQAQP
jgi:uncharacterized membrane protein (UPF0127 family)